MDTSVISSIVRFFSSLRMFFLQGIPSPSEHYSAFLPEKTGVITGILMNFFFRNIRIDKNQINIIKELPKDSIIIYTSKYRSHFEYLFFFTRFRKLNLPYPTIGFDHRVILWQPLSHLVTIIYSHTTLFFRTFKRPDPFDSGHIKQQLLSGRVAIMSLIGKASFYKWFVKNKTDPIEYLIDIQNTTKRSVIIVPELMFFSLKPSTTKLSLIDILFGSQERPGKLRRLITLFSPSKTSFIEIAEPLNLKDHLNRPEMQKLTINEQAASIRRMLITRVNRHRQTITGPVLKSREEIKESILTSDRLAKYIQNHATEKGISERQVKKKASGYLDEIAANYSYKWLSVFRITLDWLFKHLFEGIVVDTKGIARVKEKSVKAPLILVPCHKSHLDYLILSYMFNKYSMPCPHIAAGKNLSFWPLGTIFRGGGAFFMRRTFKGQKLYSKLFSEYVKKLLNEGFNIEFFIEGTRSRTGKLLPPKLGILSILINAFREKACDDLLFVPVFFGYDRVLEENAYLHELEGGEKPPESVGQIFKARQVLKKRYGKVYINFHEPISLKQYIMSNTTDFVSHTNEKHKKLCRDFGYRLINAISDVSIATPYGIVASGILNNSRKRFTCEQLLEDIDMYIGYLTSRNIRMAETLTQNRDRVVRSVIRNYISRKFISMGSENETGLLPETVLAISPSKRPVLGYYKNNSIVFFVSAAYTALSILSQNSFQFKWDDLMSSYSFLRTLFDTEFAWDRGATPDHYIRKDIKAFINESIVKPHPTLPGTYTLTVDGLTKLKRFAAFLKHCLESYLIVLYYFKRYPKVSSDEKTTLKKVKAIGKNMYRNHEIKLTESLSDITFKNALNVFTEKGLNDAKSKNNINFYLDKLQSYLSLTG